MQNRKIDVVKRGTVCKIILNDPKHLNILGAEMIKDLDKTLRKFSNDSSCRSIIITGAGTKAFCAGGDLKYINRLSGPKEVAGFVDSLKKLTINIETMPKPVIAEINGYCLGGGLELALACDIRIASSRSTFGFPEATLGIMPGGGGTYRLPSIVGVGNAKYMILTGERIDANEAFRIGLVNAVTTRIKLDAYSERIARLLSSNSQSSIKEAKLALYKNSKPDYSAERDGFIKCFKHRDRGIGIKAFLDHRPHSFDNG